MKLKIAVIAFIALFGVASFAQQAPARKNYPVLRPSFVVSDIYLALNILENVDLKGSEVDQYLEVRKQLQSYLDMAQKKNFKSSDTITVNMSAPIAQNTVVFLGRATIKGSMAAQYKRFVDAIVQASKDYKAAQGGK